MHEIPGEFYLKSYKLMHIMVREKLISALDFNFRYMIFWLFSADRRTGTISKTGTEEYNIT